MPLPDYVLVHTASALEYDEPQTPTPEWVEGEPGPSGGGTPTPGAPFPCVLFMPTAGGDVADPYRRRVVEQPTLLFNPTREDGTPVSLLRESDVLVTAAELAPWTGGETVRWSVVGEPQPFGPPGEVFGVQATLRAVQD